MTWFKVDDTVWCHPKFLMLSDAAQSLWLRAGAWSAQTLTDGDVPSIAMTLLRGTDDAAEELVASGLWERADDGYRFHDWLKYQPSKDDVVAKRDATAKRVRKWRESRNAVSNGVTNNVTNSVSNTVSNSVGNASPDPTRPDPTRPSYIGDTRAKEASSTEPSQNPVKRKNVKTLIPDGWHPSEHHVQTAGERGIDLATEAEKFKAYAESNAKRYANWDQAFNNWLLNASNFNKPQQQGYVNRSQQRYEQNMQRVRNAQIAERSKQPQLTGGSDNAFGF